MRIALVVLAFVLTSCVTQGHNFSSNINWIKNGATTKIEVDRILGKPFSVGHASGKPTWTYGYYQYKVFGASYTKELKLYWDENNTVSNFSFTSSFPDDIKSKY